MPHWTACARPLASSFRSDSGRPFGQSCHSSYRRLVTASPEQHARRDTLGWYVHTNQGVVLSRQCATEAEARAEGNVIAAELRTSMRREHYTEAKIADRVAALRVGYGVRVHPHGGFAAL